MARGIPACQRLLPCFIFTALCFKSVVCTWSLWGEWSEGPCSVSCGEGKQVVTRTRFCNSGNNDCPGLAVDKKTVPCQQRFACGDLTCYECNVFRSGQITPCENMATMRSCRACLKSYTKVRLHDRLGYTKDSVVVSRLCVQHNEFSEDTEEGCTYKRNNGGVSVVCHCFSDKCNSGVRQGPSLLPFLFIGLFWTWKLGLLDENVHM